MSSDLQSLQKPSSTKKTAMVWTDGHDVLLCREIIAADPFFAKKGTVLRSTKWAQVASTLSLRQDLKFKVDKRSVRDRYNLLADRLREKFKREARASGIATEMNECKQALEFLIEKEDAAEELHKEASDEKRRKVAEDQARAEDVRLRAMEKLAGTRKRKAEGAEGTARKRRSNGNETVQLLREKNEQQLNLAKQRLELQEKQQETEARRHEELVRAMHQQQQAQMQQFQMMMAQFQQSQQQQLQQNSELMLKLFELAKK